MSKPITITPSAAKTINQRITDHFAAYPKHNKAAVTPDGNIFFADDTNTDKNIAKLGERGLHDAQDHARKKGWGDVILVSKDSVVEPNAAEPTEVKVTSSLTRTKTPEEKQAEAEALLKKQSDAKNKKTAGEVETKINGLIKAKKTTQAVQLFDKQTDEVKALISAGTLTALGIDPHATETETDETDETKTEETTGKS